MTAPAEQIVVGIDEMPQSRPALRWAVEAAAGRGAAVRVVRPCLDQSGRLPLEDCQAELDAAVAYAVDRLGAGRASGQVVHGTAARAILGAAADATLIALCDQGGTDGLRSAAAVIAAAPCPVIIVRGNNRPGPVVLGTDGTANCEEPVAFAFEEADRAGVPLTVTYSWQPPHPYDEDSAVATKRALLETGLAETVRPYREKFPGVRVQVTVVMGRPAAALAELTRDASLLVVGSRGHGQVGGPPVGSVGQDLLHQASCSIAVVHTPA
ncbi:MULTISPECIES: universal stress protein [unclassified Kribbella]|uniref:universal stress protein n=1 Tax=unclassified Kribbella TaxID=2644121 RepID=UPI0030191B68